MIEIAAFLIVISVLAVAGWAIDNHIKARRVSREIIDRRLSE